MENAIFIPYFNHSARFPIHETHDIWHGQLTFVNAAHTLECLSKELSENIGIQNLSGVDSNDL